MLWNIIVILWWIGVGISFLVSCGMSAFSILAPNVPNGERVGSVVGIWIRWVVGLVTGIISLIVIGFILFALGFPIRGITVTPR